MSLVGTLGKVALGIAVAKGMGKMMGGSRSGGGGLTDMLGSGGLGGLLGGAGGAGGLGSLLGGQSGSASQEGGMLGNQANQQGGSAGGLGGLLGGAQSGGLGGLLESLGGAGAAGGASSGGFGDLFNSALQGNAPQQQPDQRAEETAKILIQAMVNAAKADGQIDQAEQQKIVENLGDEVSEEEREFVLSEMQSPLDVAGFIQSVPRGAEQQVYLMSLMAIDLDSKEEAQYLDQIRKGLGITEQASNTIHEQLGAPKLYA